MKREFVANKEIFSNVTGSTVYGIVYYVDVPWVCEKKDLDKVKTGDLAGRRCELIVSSDEFNRNGVRRYTVPISTYSVSTKYDENNTIIYRDPVGILRVLHLEQLRSRKEADFRTGMSAYKYKVDDEFMEVVTGILVNQNLKPNEKYACSTEQIKLMDKMKLLEQRIANLEKRVIVNATATAEATEVKEEQATEIKTEIKDNPVSQDTNEATKEEAVEAPAKTDKYDAVKSRIMSGDAKAKTKAAKKIVDEIAVAADKNKKPQLTGKNKTKTKDVTPPQPVAKRSYNSPSSWDKKKLAKFRKELYLFTAAELAAKYQISTGTVTRERGKIRNAQ